MPPQRRHRKHIGSICCLALLAVLAAPGCQAFVPPPPPDAGFVLPPALPPACVSVPGWEQRGTASWYGRAHHGKRTASGEAFDMNDLTAAHRSLPLGTRIKVTNLSNGKSVVLTVNDRGPYIRGRLVDVSYRAAQELDFTEESLTRVIIQKVEGC